jgi:fimbrial chaperone protein
MRIALASLGAAACMCAAGIGLAASLRVLPVTLELVAPDAAAAITLRNDDTQATIRVQTRVFRWTQADGRDRFEPTTDVVASPPATSLGPLAEYIIRVVRVARTPVAGEESYRIIIDELPDASRRRSGMVSFVLRQSIPAFFRARDAGDAEVTWSARQAGNAVVVIGRNTGKRRLKVAELQVTAGPRVLGKQPGLVGYVLAQSTAEFSIPLTGGRLAAGQTISLSGKSDDGPFTGTATLQ